MNNNSVYGNTMENARNRINLKLAVQIRTEVKETADF